MTREELRKHTCCFTGHRRIPKEDLKTLKSRLRAEIVCLFE